MNLWEIKEAVKQKEYDFLKENKHLGSNTILLTLGGSHAYGMDVNTKEYVSDIDLRGVALNNKEEILLGKDFEQVVEIDTDTTVYSFNKILQLLKSNNPNTIEILGCKPEHYLYLSDVGRELLNNRKMFLSKICINSFAGYASSQLRRMENKAARLVGQAQNEEYILKSINNASYDFKNRYFPMNDGSLNLYTDKAVQEGYDTEIFMDLVLEVLIDELGYSASDIAFFSNDEIVIDMEKYKDCINKQKILEMAVNVRFNIPFRIELFYLHKITGTDGYYKEIVRNIIEREYEFKCLNNYTLPFVLRKFNREEITENDKVFYHEGLLSKFMEVPNMEVKLNENKYSV